MILITYAASTHRKRDDINAWGMECYSTKCVGTIITYNVGIMQQRNEQDCAKRALNSRQSEQRLVAVEYVNQVSVR